MASTDTLRKFAQTMLGVEPTDDEVAAVAQMTRDDVAEVARLHRDAASASETAARSESRILDVMREGETTEDAAAAGRVTLDMLRATKRAATAASAREHQVRDWFTSRGLRVPQHLDDS